MNFDYRKARLFLEKRNIEKMKQNETLFEKATLDFNNILRVIITKYNPEKVYQWGSLLKKKNFRDYSDIDIAVEGIKTAEDFFGLYRDIEMLSDFPIDLVEFEKIEPEFRDSL